jgi:ParB family transcriptional regulator, chromosome partitioning protein
MASFKKDMVANIAGSMQDRSQGSIRGESPGPETPAKSSVVRQSEGRRRLDTAAVIRVDRIVRDPNQPRVEFEQESLDRLAQSLKERGQLQPVRVRWDDAASHYVVVLGERRWRAAQLAGLETLACVVVTGEPAPDDLLEDQLVENCLREDLKPMEQARAFKSLLANRSLSQRQLAERLHVGQASIAKALALLNLPEDIQASVDAGAIGPDVAYELTKVANPAEQAALARETTQGLIKRDEIKERARAQRSGAAKGRGANKSRKVTSRCFRLAGGKVTVELKKGSGNAAITGLLRDALQEAEAQLAEETSASAA